MPYWITRCQVKRFIHRYSVDICFTSITKVQGPFNRWEEARDTLNAGGAAYQRTDEGSDHTWTEYQIFTDEDIAREMRLLREAMNHQ